MDDGGQMTANLTVRDWFAAQADIPRDAQYNTIDLAVATAIMGSAPPPFNEGAQTWAGWMIEAEARIRYAKADAMMKVRSQV